MTQLLSGQNLLLDLAGSLKLHQNKKLCACDSHWLCRSTHVHPCSSHEGLAVPMIYLFPQSTRLHTCSYPKTGSCQRKGPKLGHRIHSAESLQPLSYWCLAGNFREWSILTSNNHPISPVPYTGAGQESWYRSEHLKPKYLRHLFGVPLGIPYMGLLPEVIYIYSYINPSDLSWHIYIIICSMHYIRKSKCIYIFK